MYINPNNRFNNTDDATQKIIALLAGQGHELHIKAGETVINQGQQCDFFFIVVSGCFRAYRYLNDKEVIIGFSFAGDIDTAPFAFITKSHSTETIEAVTDSSIIKIYRSSLDDLIKAKPQLRDFVELMLAQYIEVLVQRYMEFKAFTAEQAYHILYNRQPQQVKNIPLKYIASYLGISQERLSRIRSKLMQLT